MSPLQLIDLISVIVVAVLLLLVLFEPPLRYRVNAIELPPDSEGFLRLMAGLAGSPIHRCCQIELLSDGHRFYQAEIEAIRKATRSVHIEAFIFHPSAVADRFLNALVDRAKNGVQVKVVLDAVGSFLCPNRYFQPLREAGGRVCRYQPLRLATLKRFNNRTHRELIVIDGRVGFIGGAGIATHWEPGEKGTPPWRDMMFRVGGELAGGLQTAFAENWLESSGEVLAGAEDFPAQEGEDDDHRLSTGRLSTGRVSTGMIVISSPTSGRSTRNRVLFQTLIASARRTITVHSPYFMPDRSATGELCAARARGTLVKVIVPGRANNHPLTRLASRRRYGTLLQAGVEIYEYQPGMIHTKSMTVDGVWVVVGSTNFDSRSFDLNDEVNLMALDAKLAAEVEREFAADLEKCKRITHEQWRRRSLAEQLAAMAGRLLERQE